MRALKMGLIGCGTIGRSIHLEILTRLHNVSLIALAESDAQRRADARRRVPKAVTVDSYRELLAIPDVEAVVICLPNAIHAEATVEALRWRKHVYLEKPLALTLDEARKVLSVWGDASVVGMIGFNYRFNELYQAARRHIQSRVLGQLVGVRSVFSTAVRTQPTWKQTRHSGGGVLLEMGSHHVDLVRFLLGTEVREVFADLRSHRSEDDSATLELTLANGLLVQSFFSMSAVEEDRFEVYGQSGKLTVDRYFAADATITDPIRRPAPLSRLRQGVHSLARSPYLVRKMLAVGHEPSYRTALAVFAAAALANRPARPDFWDGYCSLAVLKAAEESARIGRRVIMPEQAAEGAAIVFGGTQQHG